MVAVSAAAFSLHKPAAPTPVMPHAMAPIAQENAVAEKSQFEITENDAGKTYTFALGSHFGVFLDEPNHPQKYLTCMPNNIVVPGDESLVVTKPLWGVRLYAVGVGTCTLRDKDFSMKIVVQDN